jgi:hypothetical protein
MPLVLPTGDSSRWATIRASLQPNDLLPPASVHELWEAISAYKPDLPPLAGLEAALEGGGSVSETEFFESLLPAMVQMALRLPEEFPGQTTLPLITPAESASISLPASAATSLLANSKLCFV